MEKSKQEKLADLHQKIIDIIDFLESSEDYKNRVKKDGSRDSIINDVLSAERVKRVLEQFIAGERK